MAAGREPVPSPAAGIVMCADLLAQRWGQVGEQGLELFRRYHLGFLGQQDRYAFVDAVEQARFHAEQGLWAAGARGEVAQGLSALRAPQHFEKLGG